MDKQQREKKFERTSKEQLQCYIAYVKGNPGLLAGKNNPTQPRLLEEMWMDVANKLNAPRGATRTPAKWKESLANWKKQLRSRARRHKAEQMLTGGGPKPAELDDFDSQALAAMGLIAVEGIPAQELGFEECINSPTEALEVTMLSDDGPCSPVISISSLCSSSNASLPSSSSPIEAIPSRRRYKRGTSEELVEVVLKQLKKREAFEERVFEQLKATTGAVAKLGEGMLALAEALKKIRITPNWK